MANLTQANKEAVRAVARNLRMDPNELGALILHLQEKPDFQKN